MASNHRPAKVALLFKSSWGADPGTVRSIWWKEDGFEPLAVAGAALQAAARTT